MAMGKQQSSGTPVENVNPLGRQVTLLSAVMLNLGQILGSGIFSVPGSVLSSVGSPGLLLVYWALTPVFAFAGLALYSEYASMYPKRSGGQVAYLEEAYPRPRFMVSAVFAINAVLLSFSASNAIVFAQYTLTVLSIPVTPSSQTTLALIVAVVDVIIISTSTKWSLRIVNALSIIKTFSLVFMALTGVAVLAGLTHIKDPYANFHDIFEGSTSNPNSLSTAFLKTNHSFIGWANAFNVLGEIRSTDPARTARKAGFLSLTVVTILFLIINLAYISAVPREDLRNSGQLVAALFFQNVFGDSRILSILVSCACLGNIQLYVIYLTVYPVILTGGNANARTRIIREVARQGFLPYASFFTSTKPFGTPIGPVSLRFGITAIVLLALPSRDAFNFLIDFMSYPTLVFNSAVAIGIWRIRKRRAKEGLPKADIQVHNSLIVAYLASSVALLVLPWIPPDSDHRDVSFWYATYCVAGIVFLLLCLLYYYLWIIFLPRLGGYEIIEVSEELSDGSRKRKLVRQYDSQSDERQTLLDVS
ncbi:hypothetical protein AX16_002662 [Volvariella volvacea WC 439]|nr:hypothetical protein AX16_002662 [Volvariella volvacea WC 439]